jgi:hypothetical protein
MRYGQTDRLNASICYMPGLHLYYVSNSTDHRQLVISSIRNGSVDELGSIKIKTIKIIIIE